MRKRIVPYPTVNDRKTLERLGVEVKWQLFDRKRTLSYEEISDCQYRITDKVWYPDASPLMVHIQVKIKNPLLLFDGYYGSERSAVAARSSVLGLALRWKLPKTNLQGAFHCQDVSVTTKGDLQFRANLAFPPKVIRFELDLEVVLYLKDCNPAERVVFTKSLGALLGCLERFVLITGGSGGYFPTVTENVEGGPLWRIHSSINEPEDFNEDFSSDFFCLVLNGLHPQYDDVYVTSREGQLFVSPLMFEVFVNACCVLISKACKYLSENGKSWELSPDEKDEQTLYVNFKALKHACLPECSKKEILDMELEDLFLNVRTGLSKLMKIDVGESGK